MPKFPRSLLKTLDFALAKDGYRFNYAIGAILYVLAMIFLNVVILNLVIALVGDEYDGVMQVRKETELKLKASMLLELYELKL